MSANRDLLRTAADEFHENGWVGLRSVVPRETAAELAAVVERCFRSRSTDPGGEQDLVRGGVSIMRVFEFDRVLRDLLVLEPVIDLVEAILGPDCHVVAQNALRTPRGRGIVNWHIDDALFFPFLARPGMNAAHLGTMPCYSLNVLLALTDVDGEEFGPTQVVAGSHQLGAEPEWGAELPTGATAISLLARAGDVHLVNSQTWHRGAQNRSDRTRYLLTTTYGCRFISQRFYPFLNYRMPDHVTDGASDRLLRVLGKHPKGPYG